MAAIGLPWAVVRANETMRPERRQLHPRATAPASQAANYASRAIRPGWKQAIIPTQPRKDREMGSFAPTICGLRRNNRGRRQRPRSKARLQRRQYRKRPYRPDSPWSASTRTGRSVAGLRPSRFVRAQLETANAPPAVRGQADISRTNSHSFISHGSTRPDSEMSPGDPIDPGAGEKESFGPPPAMPSQSRCQLRM